MTTRDGSQDDVVETARRAEDLARERDIEKTMSLESLSPEETLRTLQELQVHQIELEMQNQELRRAQTELEVGKISIARDQGTQYTIVFNI